MSQVHDSNLLSQSNILCSLAPSSDFYRVRNVCFKSLFQLALRTALETLTYFDSFFFSVDGFPELHRLLRGFNEDKHCPRLLGSARAAWSDFSPNQLLARWW